MYNSIKRSLDVCFALLFLLLFWWVFFIVWGIIHVVSPGPAIYKARRVGQNGKVFTCYKFRSMVIDSGSISITTLNNDSRVFPFGKFIRKTKIDEFPQIVNLLIGNMSIVGPRPEDIDNSNKIYRGIYRRILSVKPGLTSIASLYDYTHGEQYECLELYESEFLPQKLFLELYYVDHRSLLLDFTIMAKTGGIIIEKIFGKTKFKTPKELNNIT